jgi:hypothetical protein
MKAKGGSEFIRSLIAAAMQDKETALGGFDHPIYQDDGNVQGTTQEEWEQIPG